jgi:DNA-binding PucR family transcriptional regulator
VGASPSGPAERDHGGRGAPRRITAPARSSSPRSSAASRRLAPLDELPEATRERLLATLAAWLDAQGQARPAAEHLHVHVQTVRYRLGQLRDLLDTALDDPRGRLELALAV